jgi:hypothetical protein
VPPGPEPGWPSEPAGWGGRPSSGAYPGSYPGSAAYPGAWPPPLPPRKVRLTWLWVVLGILFGLGVLFVIAIVALVATLRPPVDAMNRYLADVEHGDYAAAYGRLCAAEQASTRPADFPQAIAPFKQDLADYTVYSFDPFGNERIVQYSVTDAGGNDTTYRATMVREAGAWRVCDFFQ